MGWCPAGEGQSGVATEGMRRHPHPLQVCHHRVTLLINTKPQWHTGRALWGLAPRLTASKGSGPGNLLLSTSQEALPCWPCKDCVRNQHLYSPEATAQCSGPGPPSPPSKP